MTYSGSPLTIEPIGIVHSSVLERRDMPGHGVRAQVEIFPEFRDGLLLIEDNTHLWVIGWFTGAEREQLEIVRPEYRSGKRRRGVFGLRATTRPNSIGMCVSALVEVQDGWLTLDHLDYLDGTPIIDIKRYSPSWDSVFSARSSRELMVDTTEAANLNLLEMDGVKFHGRLTPAIVAAARLLQHVIRQWQVLPRDEGLLITVPSSGPTSVYADTLQGATGATFGTGRLICWEENRFRLTHAGRTLVADPLPLQEMSIDDIRRVPLETLFRITEE
jgi:tRNA (adenine37-N6)-methyltransferase